MLCMQPQSYFPLSSLYFTSFKTNSTPSCTFPTTSYLSYLSTLLPLSVPHLSPFARDHSHHFAVPLLLSLQCFSSAFHLFLIFPCFLLCRIFLLFLLLLLLYLLLYLLLPLRVLLLPLRPFSPRSCRSFCAA